MRPEFGIQGRKLEVNGVGLNVEEVGTGPALVLLHGFTGSAASWREQAAIYAQTHRVIAIDALGHGLSDVPEDASRYSLSNMAADFVAMLDQLDIEQTALLGYSMGGRMALQIALDEPERISRLILESASPGLESAAERQARTASDNALADRIECEGIEAFVNYWEKLPLWESQSQLLEEVRAAQRAARLKNNPKGLANSLRGAGTGVQDSLWERLSSLNVPTLLLTGELDPKFYAIARQMQAKLPDAQLKVVAGAGHTIHLEQPQVFDKLVTEFLSKSGDKK